MFEFREKKLFVNILKFSYGKYANNHIIVRLDLPRTSLIKK